MSKRYAPEEPPEDLPLFEAMDRMFDAIEFDPVVGEPDPRAVEATRRILATRAYLSASGAPPVLGETFDPAEDEERLGAQFLRVRAVMDLGAWRTLQEVSVETGDPEASVSARIRDLRRAGYEVQRRRRGEAARGIHEYRALPKSHARESRDLY